MRGSWSPPTFGAVGATRRLVASWPPRCAAATGTRKRRSRSDRLQLPASGIAAHEPVRVDVELGREGAVGLIAVGAFAGAPVSLLERLEPKARKCQPRRAGGGGVARLEGQPSDGQHVGRRAEGEVDVHAAPELGLRAAV